MLRPRLALSLILPLAALAAPAAATDPAPTAAAPADVPPVLIPWPLRPEPRGGTAAPASPPPVVTMPATPNVTTPAPPRATPPAASSTPLGPVPSPPGAPATDVVVADDPPVPLVSGTYLDPTQRLAAMKPGEGLPAPSLEPDAEPPPEVKPAKPRASEPAMPSGPREQRPPGAPGPAGPTAPATAPAAEPPSGVASSGAPRSKPPVAKGPPQGTLTEDEIQLLLPTLDLPQVKAQVAVTELTPPTQEVRRWQFAPIEGLTWESQEAAEDGDWIILRGQVDIRAGLERIRADEVKLNQVTRRLEAEGNVILDRQDARLTGRRLEYDVDTNTGLVFDAMGYTGDDLSFTSSVAEKVAADKYVLRGGSFTSCTQPSPLWQVKASKAVVHIDKFVYLWNPRVFLRKVPASYLPWVAFPIKQDRAMGFMIPKVSSSSRRGTSVAEEFFWPITRSTDLTIGGTWWSSYGFRANGQARWFLPGMTEYGYLEGIYLKANKGKEDQKLKPERYLIDWEHRQTFGKWDLTVTGEIATDPLVDEFDGQLGDTSAGNNVVDRSPIVNQKVTVQRRIGKSSLNIFLENDARGSTTTPPAVATLPLDPRRETTGTRTRISRQLPVVEWRTSGLQLGGKKWASLNLEASVGSLTQSVRDDYDYAVLLPPAGDPAILRFDELVADNDYQRADIYPQFSFPMGNGWTRVIPKVNLRATWWSRIEKDANPATFIVDPETTTIPLPAPFANDSVSIRYDLGEAQSTLLWAWDAGVTLEGPNFQRIFNLDARPGQRKWQHLVEPSIDYSYAPELDRELLIRSDQKAGHYTRRMPTEAVTAGGSRRKSGGLDQARLRLVNTLRSKRVVPQGSTEEHPRDVLIWTLSSTWNFDHDQSERSLPRHGAHDDAKDCNADGDTTDPGEAPGETCMNLREETTRFANIESDFNFRPTDLVHFSLRNTFDVLQDDLTQTSLVGGLDGDWGYTDLSFSSSRDPRTLEATRQELALTGEHWLYKGGRVRLGYDFTRQFGGKLLTRTVIRRDGTQVTFQDSRWIYRRFVLSYYNQCLGLSLSWEDNRHRGILPAQEWTFTVSLKNLGNFLRYRRRASAQ